MDRDRDKLAVGLPPPARFPPSSSTTSFIHDLSRMPETPPKNVRHRRAHSEILTLPDDITFDTDLGVIGDSTPGAPSFSDDHDIEEELFSMYIDMDKVNLAPSNADSEGGVRVRGRHQHSQSMDGSTMIKPEMLGSGSDEMASGDAKKGVSNAKLAELALIDPKRAKRIWANRQSAARSKERKMRYIAELERKVQTLQTDSTSLSAQLSLLQRDTNGLTVENSDLKMRLQTMEQQVHLQDALNDALKEEIQHLKILTGQAMSNGGPMINFPPAFGGNQPFYPSSNQAMNTRLTAQQFQQLQLHSQKQQQQQFQQLQLHQLQQHQLQQQPQHQHLGDFKLRPSMPSPKDHMSDSKPNPAKD